MGTYRRAKSLPRLAAVPDWGIYGGCAVALLISQVLGLLPALAWASAHQADGVVKALGLGGTITTPLCGWGLYALLLLRTETHHRRRLWLAWASGAIACCLLVGVGAFRSVSKLQGVKHVPVPSQPELPAELADLPAETVSAAQQIVRGSATALSNESKEPTAVVPGQRVSVSVSLPKGRGGSPDSTEKGYVEPGLSHATVGDQPAAVVGGQFEHRASDRFHVGTAVVALPAELPLGEVLRLDFKGEGRVTRSTRRQGNTTYVTEFDSRSGEFQPTPTLEGHGFLRCTSTVAVEEVLPMVQRHDSESADRAQALANNELAAARSKPRELVLVAIGIAAEHTLWLAVMTLLLYLGGRAWLQPAPW